MTITATPRRKPVTARRTGYVIAVAVNAALLYLTYVRPGWRAVPFLTGETPQVLSLFTISLVAAMAWNLLYLADDRPWLTALGDLVTTGIALAVLVRIWQVFPFDFAESTESAVDWAMVVRVVLVFAIGGTAIGVVAHAVSVARHALGAGSSITR